MVSKSLDSFKVRTSSKLTTKISSLLVFNQGSTSLPYTCILSAPSTSIRLVLVTGIPFTFTGYTVSAPFHDDDDAAQRRQRGRLYYTCLY